MSAAETQFTASATLLTGISRVNVDNRDTCFKSFVFDKRLQLPKSPGVRNLPLLPGSDVSVCVWHSSFLCFEDAGEGGSNAS